MTKRIKKTYICKDVYNYEIEQNFDVTYKPVAGDVAVFEILKIGKHKTIQGESKRNNTIITGDWIMAAFGTRYATEQFEGYLPGNLEGEFHILGAGGTVGILESAHAKFRETGPTLLRLIGMVKDRSGSQLNTKVLKGKAIQPFTGAAAKATRVILSLGSSMDSGKTTSAAYLVSGMKKAGLTVAYIKLTGTVYTKDADLAWDMGADKVIDFGDFGFPSTYMCSERELLDLYESAIAQTLAIQPDYVIMEIADGIFQRETSLLLKNKYFHETVEGVIYSAGDSLSAVQGLQTLQGWGYYPLALCGLFTASPLLIREVQQFTNTRVCDLAALSNPEQVNDLFGAVHLQMTV